MQLTRSTSPLWRGNCTVFFDLTLLSCFLTAANGDEGLRGPSRSERANFSPEPVERPVFWSVLEVRQNSQYNVGSGLANVQGSTKNSYFNPLSLAIVTPLIGNISKHLESIQLAY